MKKKRKKRKDGYVLLPSVTHPQGREKAFEDAMKAMVRAMTDAVRGFAAQVDHGFLVVAQSAGFWRRVGLLIGQQAGNHTGVTTKPFGGFTRADEQVSPRQYSTAFARG